MSVVNAWNTRFCQSATDFKLSSLEIGGRFSPILVSVEGRLALNPGIVPAILSAIDEHKPSLIVGSFWGDQHFFASAANNPRRFDFVPPNDSMTEFDSEAELVPYDLVRTFVSHYFFVARLLISAIREASAVPMTLMPAPPPVRDFSSMPYGSSSKRIDALVAEFGAAPASLRRKFWRLCSSIFQEIAAETGVSALDLPPGVTDSQGFRSPEYYSQDWIHANTAYGDLVLQQISQHLGANRVSKGSE